MKMTLVDKSKVYVGAGEVWDVKKYQVDSEKKYVCSSEKGQGKVIDI